MLNAIILSEVNCVSDNTCTFLPMLWRLSPLPYLPQRVVCMVSLYSGVLLYYVVTVCCNVTELGAVEGWFV